MKQLLYIFAFVLLAAQGFGQDVIEVNNKPSDEPDSNGVYVAVDEMPEYPGGIQSLIEYLQANINYPTAAKENGYSGKSFVKFIVDSTGNIVNPKILKSSGCILLDDEALRVVNFMPNWKMGKNQGKNVNVYFNLPINFKLNNGRDKVKKISPKEYDNYYYNLALEYGNAKKFNLAVKYYNKALGYNKSDVDAFFNLGAMFVELKKIDSACLAWRTIKSMGRNDADELLSKYCGDNYVKGQEEKFTVVEKMPEYPGGMGELLKFVQGNLKAPKGVKAKDLTSDKVFVKFVVESDGSVSSSEVIKSSGNNLVDQEALRVVNLMPKWNPGMQNGIPVPVYFNVPIKFNL